jgi:SOS response associated peptidase (SRAP)
VSWKLSRTVLRGAVGGNADRLLDQKLDAKTKQPFAIAMKDGQPYALAGLWEKWKDRQARTELLTFTVITTDPNEVVQPIHDRMPVIIPERDYDRWLKADPDRPPIDLLRPYDADRMTAWKVDKAVGDVKNDSPELIDPASTTPNYVDEGSGETPGFSLLVIPISGMAVFSQSEKAD